MKRNKIPMMKKHNKPIAAIFYCSREQGIIALKFWLSNNANVPSQCR